MGSFAKALGQLVARSVETEGGNILQRSRANKISGSLSLALDATLRDAHDMRVFGAGTLASLSEVERYGRFTNSMHTVYNTMEDELDRTTAEATSLVWLRHGDVLRRSKRLKSDLHDVGMTPTRPVENSPTERYASLIRRAGEADRRNPESSGRLLGHLYCRYFADLFGGQMLGAPTRLALSLPKDSARHYDFDFGREESGLDRRSYIERVYGSLNDAGELMGEVGRRDAVEEAYSAFAANVDVYAEEPLLRDGVIGAWNVTSGFLRSRASMSTT